MVLKIQKQGIRVTTASAVGHTWVSSQGDKEGEVVTCRQDWAVKVTSC